MIDVAVEAAVSDRFRLRVDAALPMQRITAIFGPSGVGKTTLLKCLAGLCPFARGTIRVDGDTWLDATIVRPPHQRRVGYVPQSGVLFAHLNVAGNLAYAAKRSGASKAQIDATIAETGLTGLAHRQVNTLSGGERQRVALARALLAQPTLLLLDEPVTALDYNSRDLLLTLIRDLADARALTVLYVSHGIDEVAALADDVLLLDNGKVLDHGAASSVLALHRSGQFSEQAGALIEATVSSIDTTWSLATLQAGSQTIRLPAQPFAQGRSTRLRILARDVSVSRDRHDDSSVLNQWAGVVARIDEGLSPSTVMVEVDCQGTSLLAEVTRLSVDRLKLAPGESVYASFKTASLLRSHHGFRTPGQSHEPVA